MNFEARKYANKRLREELAFLKDQHNDIQEEMAAYRNDFKLASSTAEKVKIKKILEQKNEELVTIEFEIEKIERELYKGNFPRRLFDHFAEFDFEDQRLEVDNYLKKPSNVVSLVIHSQAEYQNVREQFWLWKYVLLGYFPQPSQVLFFYNKHLSNLPSLVYELKKAIDKSKYEVPEVEETDEEISREITQFIIPDIIRLLNSKTVVIPVYLSQTHSHYYLIYEFINKVWIPVCKHIHKTSTGNNKLILVIIDDDPSDQNYFVSDIEKSIRSFKPYAIPTCSKVKDFDLESWIRQGRIRRDGVFREYEELTKGFISKFSKRAHYNDYLPRCGRVEKLFEKICKDLHSEKFDYSFDKLVAEYGK